MDALSGKRVEVGRERRGKGLSLTGLHLRDLAGVEHDAAHELHVEVAHVEDSLRCLPDVGERFRNQVFKLLSVLHALSELVGLGPQLLVLHFLELGLKGVDLCNNLAQLPDGALVAASENLRKNIHIRTLNKTPRQGRSPRRLRCRKKLMGNIWGRF